jgi:cysteine-S-conjugate beta-lyase
MKLETLLANIVHYSGIADDKGASHMPIYNTATFDLKRQSGEGKVYEYSRSTNPTRNSLEQIFTLAEKGAGCICTNAGVAALALLFDVILRAGDSVLVEKDCYGGTNRLLNALKDKMNIRVMYADLSLHDETEQILSGGKYKLLLCESPTNPGMKILDLAALARIAHKYDVLFAVDNSLATFASQRPLEYGADFSVFSTTKFVSGHGAVVAGAIVARDPYWVRKMELLSKTMGYAQSPMDAFLVSLGLPTLMLRMKAQEASALLLSEWLERHPDVAEVKYAGSTAHPQYALARRQMDIFPGVITVNMVSEEKARQLIGNTHLFGEKASFGSPDSRMEIPSKMSHASFTPDQLAEIGLTRATVRIAVGLENVQDLIEDIEQALR